MTRGREVNNDRILILNYSFEVKLEINMNNEELKIMAKYLPSSHAEGFPCTADSDGSVPHSREGCCSERTLQNYHLFTAHVIH